MLPEWRVLGRAWAVCPLLLLLKVRVPMAAIVSDCMEYEYKPEGLNLCCEKCPAGHYVSKHCDKNHGAGVCSPCEPGSYLPYRNGETNCRLCSRCREDQEVVSPCTATRDQQCQCKPGYFCDSENCVENCFRCQSCPDHVSSPCNATRDTVCNTQDTTDTSEKKPEGGSLQMFVLVVITITIIVIVVVVALIFLLVYCYKKKGMWLYQRLISLLKGRVDEQSSTVEILFPSNPENHQPALDIETLLLKEGLEESPHPRPLEETEEGIELQDVVVRESPPAPEQVVQTPALAVSVSQNQNEVFPSLKSLEQEYAKRYFVKDTSNEGTTRLYYEFEEMILDKNWKSLMRLIGLEEKDIETCEHENSDNLTEQHHKMLLRWRNKLGREASVFKLLAALHKMQLHMCLENIINVLLVEGILGRHAETSD
ncbi:tumor necrosis factor receptor superfamily member 10A-like isoform X1 [Canis lupus dingo]|uniref:tumor necrosis factor receptor superfamily member 10A-like isoform X1 n=1 Tax=Canis lupus dingo TaxID=286419 RepID=UPI0020C31D00|nr:tumor necrosis factor receptor superfamily member 10A-like isoform X1 [Canis lupus dingo]